MRGGLLLVLGGVIAASVMWLGARDTRPNVVLIMVDTLRRDHVGLYGYSRDTTPEIDAFFAGETIFEHATSPAPCTDPAVKQVLTGARDYDTRRPRLAETLTRAGYATAAVVSQHHFRTPTGPVADYRRGFALFDVQDADQRDHHDMTVRGAREVSDRALAWLEARPRGQPFFLWLHYFDPHDPYWPPPVYRVFDAPDETINGDRRRALKQAMAAALATADGPAPRARFSARNRHGYFGHIFSPDQVTTLRGYYDGEILYADDEIGRVLRRLEDEGLRDATLVILTSDHGEHLGEGDRWAHCQSLHGYEIDVPLLVSSADGEPGAHIAHAVSTLDIAPTVLDAVGISYDATRFDGRSLFESSADRLVYSVWDGEHALQAADWKLSLSTGEGHRMLYDIRDDRAEARDLSVREPARHARMAEALDVAMQDDDDMQERLTETLERLRAIGYLE